MSAYLGKAAEVVKTNREHLRIYFPWQDVLVEAYAKATQQDVKLRNKRKGVRRVKKE